MLYPAVRTEKSRAKKTLKGENLRLGIIDVGTNSLRFDMYDVTSKSVRRFHREKRMIRLGDGVFKTGKISPEAFERGLKAFKHIRSVISDMDGHSVMAFGTSALRSAKNARSFVKTVKRQTGIGIRIISGDEEGELIAKGIMEHTRMPKGITAMVDIGGGSTEVTIASGKRVLERHSFRLGANRLQQMFLKDVPPMLTRGSLHPILALRQHVRETLAVMTQRSQRNSVKFGIGSSGTIRTLSRILKKIDRGDDAIERMELAALVAEMSVMTRQQLLTIPGLEPKRVDLILAGGILLEEILFALKIRKMTVTDFALRDGILLSALSAIGR